MHNFKELHAGDYYYNIAQAKVQRALDCHGPVGTASGTTTSASNIVLFLPVPLVADVPSIALVAEVPLIALVPETPFVPLVPFVPDEPELALVPFVPLVPAMPVKFTDQEE